MIKQIYGEKNQKSSVHRCTKLQGVPRARGLQSITN